MLCNTGDHVPLWCRRQYPGDHVEVLQHALRRHGMPQLAAGAQLHRLPAQIRILQGAGGRSPPYPAVVKTLHVSAGTSACVC